MSGTLQVSRDDKNCSQLFTPRSTVSYNCSYTVIDLCCFVIVVHSFTRSYNFSEVAFFSVIIMLTASPRMWTFID